MAINENNNQGDAKKSPSNSESQANLPRQTFWEKQIFAFNELIKAIKRDRRIDNLQDSPQLPPDKKGTFTKSWIKEYWAFMVLWVLAVWVILNASQPQKVRAKRSHHGINKYGERY